MPRIRKKSDLLSPKHLVGTTTTVEDQVGFERGLAGMLKSLSNPTEMRQTLFCSDNMVLWNRSLSFMRDPYFRGLVDDETYGAKHRGIIWRTYLLEYFAQIASCVEGDFLEVGCYQGDTASVLTDRIDFAALNKRYLLFDLFEWHEGDQHLDLPALVEPGLYEKVCARFADNEAVSVIKGPAPATFDGTLPERVAFAHIDMNDVEAEAGAVAQIYPRLSAGGVLILDDYGWWMHSDQKVAVDAVLRDSPDSVAELPTGQGLLIKRR